MIYTTKRNVGDRFWVPRVYSDYEEDSVLVNGKTYVHRNYRLAPKVKEKAVVEVNVEITSAGTKESYIVVAVKDGVQEGAFQAHMHADAKTFDNPEEALQFAIGWMNERQETYHG